MERWVDIHMREWLTTIALPHSRATKTNTNRRTHRHRWRHKHRLTRTGISLIQTRYFVEKRGGWLGSCCWTGTAENAAPDHPPITAIRAEEVLEESEAEGSGRVREDDMGLASTLPTREPGSVESG